MQSNAIPTTKLDENPDESRGVAHYNSDTDDWTFVSSASSASRGSSNSSSPERGSLGTTSTSTSQVRDTTTTTTSGTTSKHSIASINQATQACATQQQQSTDSTTSSDHPLSQQPKVKKHISHHKRKIGSSERADDADDESDGMTEINLSDNNADEHSISGASFSNLGLTTARMEDLKEEEDQNPVKEQDLQLLENEINRHARQMGASVDEVTAIHLRKTISTSTEASPTTLATLSNSESTQTTHETRLGNDRSHGPNWDLLRKAAYKLPLIMLAVFMLANRHIKHTSNKLSDSANSTTSGAWRLVDNGTFDSVYSDPTNHAHTELKLMHEEMIECIRRENPNRKEIEHWLSMSSQELDSYHSTQTNIRPFKGLVCYDREVEWRKRFNRLKSEFSLDLRKVTRQIKRKITNEMLEKQHPALSFRLILNQLEYLDHVDQRRKDRALEKLKAENLELVRRLNKKSSSSSSSSSEVKNESHHNNHHHHHNNQGQKYQQKQYNTVTHNGNSLISLESENARLKHEIESLKERLAEKAGTVFIKQSLELEKCDRENNALKQFHQQVAQEVARNLKQLDQSHPMESLAIFEHDHDESLGSRLASTRTSLLRLGEGITMLLAKNRLLEVDLKEAKSLNEMMLADTKNLIEDANQTEIDQAQPQQQQQHQVETQTEMAADSIGLPGDEQLARVTSNWARPSFDLRRQVKDDQVDWMIKRAKLREKLRRAAPEADSQRPEPRHSPVSRHYARHTHKLNVRTAPPSHYWAGSQDDVYKRDQQQQQQQDQRKRHRKPYKSASQESANSYSHNSHKNCKHHLRRDEL